MLRVDHCKFVFILLAVCFSASSQDVAAQTDSQENFSEPMILVDGRIARSLAEAVRFIQPSSSMMIGPSVYREAAVLNQPGLMIGGYNAELRDVTTRGKGAQIGRAHV